MESLPNIITDLAYILIVAGITTVVFKILKQPLVLGYIVAGFLAGPYMEYMPTIGDHEMVEQWGQIGVIFIMFTMGLEFSFKKIVKMGFSPILCACTIMSCMMMLGSIIGNIFGWNSINSLFLGGMLAMSSTTIIYKAYEDLEFSHKKFAQKVLSVLILEDILGIMLMVVLSTIAVARKFEGVALVESFVKLASVLILWFIVGIFILPLILKKYKKYMNSETLMIVSLALCFTLVIVSVSAGYSAAFGAFMMGSILSETLEAEQIEKSVSSVKDLFGAIFFVSVGMMVDPSILIEYWNVILIITAGIILGQALMGTLSYLITGSNLRDSIHSGFSMVQIGEFAFIIAALGESLKVTDEYIYPIVVAVSIITTFITPYMIKLATPVSNFAQKYITLQRPCLHTDSVIKLNAEQKTWKTLIMALVYQTVAYLVLSSTITGIGLSVLKPLLVEFFDYSLSNMLTGIIVVIIISPFLRAICIRKNHSEEAKYLYSSGIIDRILLFIVFIVRFVISSIFVYSIISYSLNFEWYYNMGISIVIMVLICKSRLIKMVSIRLERTFKQNLNRRENQHNGPQYARKLIGQDLHIARLTVPNTSLWAGNSLSNLRLGSTNKILIASIVRGNMRINIPGKDNKLFPGDVLEVVGDDSSIESFKTRMISETASDNNIFENNPLSLRKFVINEKSNLIGKTLADSGIKYEYRCLVIGFENGEGVLESPNIKRVINVNDTLWIVGEDIDLNLLSLVTEGKIYN